MANDPATTEFRQDAKRVSCSYSLIPTSRKKIYFAFISSPLEMSRRSCYTYMRSPRSISSTMQLPLLRQPHSLWRKMEGGRSKRGDETMAAELGSGGQAILAPEVTIPPPRPSKPRTDSRASHIFAPRLRSYAEGFSSCPTSLISDKRDNDGGRQGPNDCDERANRYLSSQRNRGLRVQTTVSATSRCCLPHRHLRGQSGNGRGTKPRTS